MDHPFLEGFCLSAMLPGKDRGSFILAFSSSVRSITSFSVMFWMLEENSIFVEFIRLKSLGL